VSTRILPPDEWSRLNGTLLEGAPDLLNPEIDMVLVVEKEGEIVGCTSFLPRWHIEGLWVSPKHRKMASVGRPLLRGIYQVAEALKAKELVMMTFDPEMAALCARIGRSWEHLDGDHYSIGL
jgi:N-acetylglutamate synthase-like GNAT family acetyltransferase|tara:strand:- start:93 stop:458 length:366 start_codon:yes stop_codon:yes gene_type:complete